MNKIHDLYIVDVHNSILIRAQQPWVYKIICTLLQSGNIKIFELRYVSLMTSTLIVRFVFRASKNLPTRRHLRQLWCPEACRIKQASSSLYSALSYLVAMGRLI